jgi:hypothetical protein
LSGRAWDLVIEQRVSWVCFLWESNPRLILFFYKFPLINFVSCRLLSQGKRILGRNKGNFNGHMHKEHCTDYNHRTLRCSPGGHMPPNSIRWPRKLKGEPKSLGIYTFSITDYYMQAYKIDNYINKEAFGLNMFLVSKNILISV